MEYQIELDRISKISGSNTSLVTYLVSSKSDL